MVNIVLADNHPIIYEGLEKIFLNSAQFKFIKNVTDGYQLLNFLKQYENEVDLVLLEVDLPQLNGFSILRHIKHNFKDLKVLMFSNEPDEVYAINALKAGAKGYINKNSPIDTLKLAINKVSNNDFYLNEELKHRVAQKHRRDSLRFANHSGSQRYLA